MGPASRGAVFASLLRVTPFGRNDQLALGQEPLADLRCLVEQPAGIVAQIQDQRLHSLLVEFFQGVFQFGAGLFAKLTEPDVTNFILAQRELAFAVDILDRVHLDFCAGQLDVPHPGGGRPQYGDGHVRARRPAQPLHRLGQAKFLRALSLDFDDPVPGEYPRIERGRVLHRGDHRQKIIPDADHNSDAAKQSLRVVFQLVVFVRIHEFAVGIE